METNKERNQLLERLRTVLLARSNEQLCELLEYWFDLLIAEDAIEELLDDCCQLLDYRIISAITGQSYQTYTAWREIENRNVADGVFHCTNEKALRQRIITLSIPQVEQVITLAYQAYAVIRGDSCELTAIGLEFLCDLIVLLEDSAQQWSGSTTQPPTPAERKAERQKCERALTASVQQQGYLLLSADIPESVKNNFRHWCKQQGRPSITVKPAGKSMVTIIADAGTVSKAFEAQGKLFPGALQPSFVLSTYLHERLMQIAATYTTQSQQAVSFSYGATIVTLANVAQENSEAAIEDLLKLWVDAQVEYEAQLDIQRTAYIIRRDTPPPDPHWLAMIKCMRAQNKQPDNTPSTEAIVISEELVSRLTKEQLCVFLDLPPRSRIAKDELVQRLLTHCSVNKGVTEQFFEAFAHELALEPWELEKELECTPTERKRWTAEEKLPILATRYFRKGGRDREYPVYDRRMLFSSSEREKMELWRAEHQAHVRENRKAAAKVAAETRRAINERLSKWGPLF